MTMKDKIEIAKKKNWQGIADDIREAIANGRLKPGEMLQGEQGLASQYKVGLYSIRSALRSLKEAGILCSVPKRGIYVSGPAASGESEKTVETAASLRQEEIGADSRNPVRYVTRGALPLQQAIYNDMAQSYNSTSISSRLEIVYHQGGPNQMHPKADIYEYGSQSRFCFSNVGFVDLKKYFSHIIRSPELMFNSSSIPLFRSVPLLIYNKNLLKELKFPMPSYRTYDEQMAYLDALTSSIALQSSYCMPGTAQNMVHKFGNVRVALYKDIADLKLSVSEAKKKYMEIFQRMTRYWRKYHISYPGRTSQLEEEFVSGRSLLFFGLSSHYIRLLCKNLPFEIGATVMLSHDNTIDNDLGLISIDMETPNLVEAARVVNFMQNDEYQYRFAALGYVPMLDMARKKMPVDNLKRLQFDLAYPLIFASPEEHYITINIINVELWNVVLFDKSIDEAIESIFSFARSYLQMKLDKAAIESQSLKSDVYM